jgi:hypothetical protein
MDTELMAMAAAFKPFGRMHRAGANELARLARICRGRRVMQPSPDATA